MFDHDFFENDNDNTYRSIKRRLFMHDLSSAAACLNSNDAEIITSSYSSRKEETL